MKNIYFMNNGHFDVRAMLTFGISAKEKSDAIGFFGTGFKYAMSIILRLGGSVSIKTEQNGEIERYQFISRKEEIRGQQFDIVYMIDEISGDEKEAGFTTRLGVNWQNWMAYRELFCNAKDEGGKTSHELDDSMQTIITVCCDEIYKAYCEHERYFLPENAMPISATHEAEIYDLQTGYVFYKGVAIKEIDKALFSYNILSSVDLTEDRTLKYDHQAMWPIKKSLQQSKCEKTISRSVIPGDHFESRCFDPDFSVSQEFLAVCHRLMKTTDKGVSEAARLTYKKHTPAAQEFEEFSISKIQLLMLQKAKKFLLGIDVDVDIYPIKTVVVLGDGVMGRALDGIIYLSEIPFQMGTKQVASTLLEEWVHLKTGAKDFDLTMQSWLFDKILSVTESVNGEPL